MSEPETQVVRQTPPQPQPYQVPTTTGEPGQAKATFSNPEGPIPRVSTTGNPPAGSAPGPSRKTASEEASFDPTTNPNPSLWQQVRALGSKDKIAIGNAGETATMGGQLIALSSRPFENELFGEKVTAQFHFGVNAAMFAKNKENIGMDVGWSTLGAKAHLTGAHNISVGLIGAATMVWVKKSPKDYARRITENGLWRSTLETLVPGWVFRSMLDERIEGWLTELVGMMLSSGGDATILGATTRVGARVALSLPELHFEGGAIHCSSGAGLSFGDITAGVNLDLGRTHGMELLSLLALSGAGALFGQLKPNLSVPEFLREKLTPTGTDPKDSKQRVTQKPGKLVDWKSSNPNTKGKDHDVSYTRGKGKAGELLTGDAARADHADEEQRLEAAAEAAAQAPESSKLKTLAGKAAGVEMTVVQTDVQTSAALVGPSKGKFVGMDVDGHGLDAQAHAGTYAGLSAEKVRVNGNAQASAYIYAGKAHIETEELAFDVFGEQLSGKFGFEVDTGAFVQAQGAVNLDVGWKATGLNANLSGFGGVKAGLSGVGALKWKRKAPAHYAQTIFHTEAWKPMLADVLPRWILTRDPRDPNQQFPDLRLLRWLERLVSTMMNGGEGEALVLGGTARTEGSMGIGAAVAFGSGLRGGVLHCHGHGGLTFGLGGGANVDLALGVADGLSMLGVMSLRGASALYEAVQPLLKFNEYIGEKILQMRGDAESGPRSATPDRQIPTTIPTSILGPQER